MRALVQRVSRAAVAVDGHTVSAIGPGLLVLAAVARDDGPDDRAWLASKIVYLRVCNDAEGVMNCSVREVGGSILAVSQFTLFASTRKGNRPSWSGAAPPHVAAPAFADFVSRLAFGLGRSVPSGVFGADMAVESINDGPVTIWMDSRIRE
ncbi:MAG: D-aminoacyl-tRNA deacylase [Casimicrobiaceae bacterium]